jgi:hypothetical protein
VRIARAEDEFARLTESVVDLGDHRVHQQQVDQVPEPFVLLGGFGGRVIPWSFWATSNRSGKQDSCAGPFTPKTSVSAMASTHSTSASPASARAMSTLMLVHG